MHSMSEKLQYKPDLHMVPRQKWNKTKAICANHECKLRHQPWSIFCIAIIATLPRVLHSATRNVCNSNTMSNYQPPRVQLLVYFDEHTLYGVGFNLLMWSGRIWPSWLMHRSLITLIGGSSSLSFPAYVSISTLSVWSNFPTMRITDIKQQGMEEMKKWCCVYTCRIL